MHYTSILTAASCGIPAEHAEFIEAINEVGFFKSITINHDSTRVYSKHRSDQTGVEVWMVHSDKAEYFRHVHDSKPGLTVKLFSLPTSCSDCTHYNSTGSPSLKHIDDPTGYCKHEDIRHWEGLIYNSGTGKPPEQCPIRINSYKSKVKE